jgi:hypothetical protein
MKRILIAIAAVAALIGCQNDEPKKPAASAQVSTPSAAQSSSDSAKAAAASAKPASAKEYYEVTKNGKTYVFGKLDSVLAFRASGTLPADTIEKPSFGPNGETVVFETGGLESGLMAEYQKAHPKK